MFCLLLEYRSRTRHNNKPIPWFVDDVFQCPKSAALIIVFVFLAGLSSTFADTHYVNVSNQFPSTPFTSWDTAATNIQDAIDVASRGDTVLVTNGVYETGGVVLEDDLANLDVVLTNRIAITKVITVKSVSGPDSTYIVGRGPLGESAVRCAYVAKNAVLSGFTLTNGHTRSSGHFIKSRSGGGVWCKTGAILTDCVIVGNSASLRGGGIYQGTLTNCTLTDNSAAEEGGGAHRARLNNCTLIGNFSSINGGGVFAGWLTNCLLTANFSSINGGGAYNSSLNNCTLTGNSSHNGGGTYNSELYNCIVYFNHAVVGPNYQSSYLQYCCTKPLPVGPGNIDDDPRLADFRHLSANSPCGGAGTNAFANGTDIDGEAWLDPPSIGCDEFVSSSATGSLFVSIQAETTNVASGTKIDFVGDIQGHATASVWDFGDGSAVVSNKPYVRHAWTSAGTYQVGLKSFNVAHPEGVAATVTVHVVEEPVHYVIEGHANPQFPYSSWETAASTMQDAIEASVVGGLVLVTNGVYDTGGMVVHDGLTNRIAITKRVTVSSVSGPANTIIVGRGPLGGSAVRCAYVGTNAVLNGFTLTEGHTQSAGHGLTEDSGGGIWCELSAVVTNCVISGNTSGSEGGGVYDGTLHNCSVIDNTSNAGGGASRSTLNNCFVTRNFAHHRGGGVHESSLTNCTLTGNSATSSGGGAYGSTLKSCIVYFNDAAVDANYESSDLAYSCATPLPVGLGNIDDDPALADVSHLSEDSPCIGAGTSEYTMGTDVDGDLWLDPPSIGCDEYHASSATGMLFVSIQAETTNAASSFVIDFVGDVLGHATSNVWDFGDGSEVVSNNRNVSHRWNLPGTYQVELRAFNLTYPEGVAATVLVQIVEQPVHFVIEGHANARFPYTSWGTAASTIQDGIDAASVSAVGALVLVTNGVYDTGGVVARDGLTNRIAVAESIRVRSVNGPMNTVIVGDSNVRCAYIGSSTVLDGFMLTNGHVENTALSGGGGAWCEPSAILTNCVIEDNSADFGGGVFGGILNNCTLTANSASSSGGGASGSTLNNCALTGNFASSYGGGVSAGTLNNCTLTGNSAPFGGGGVSGCKIKNCIVYFNDSAVGANYDLSDLQYCCTTPLPSTGTGNNR